MFVDVSRAETGRGGPKLAKPCLVDDGDQAGIGRGTKKLEAAFRVAPANAINRESAPDERSRTTVAQAKGARWLDR